MSDNALICWGIKWAIDKRGLTAVMLARILLLLRELPLGLSFFFTCDDGTDELGNLSDLYTAEALSHDAQMGFAVEPIRLQNQESDLSRVVDGLQMVQQSSNKPAQSEPAEIKRRF